METKDNERICSNCDDDFNVSIDMTPEDIEREFQHKMIHCYSCGEELLKQEEERKLICVDGCGLVDIKLCSEYYYLLLPQLQFNIIYIRVSEFLSILWKKCDKRTEKIFLP